MANEAWATPEDRFGRNLRRLREDAGVSQGDLAERLKEFGLTLHPSAIAKIEARDGASPRAIRLGEAVAIASALGRPLATFLVGPEDASATRDELAKRFAEWESARQEQVRAGERSQSAFERLGYYVQDHASDLLVPFDELVRDWATAEGESPGKSELLRAMLLYRAIPTKTTEDLQDQATRAYIEEQKPDGEHPETP